MQVVIQKIPENLQEFELIAAKERQPEYICALFLCALAVSNRWLGQGMMDSAVMAACALGALAGGLLAVRQGRGRSLLMGFGAGLILFLLLLTAGFLFYESADLRNGGLGLLLSCGCGGALAGVLGGKPKKKRRR